ncbi:MAG: hypothetical protein LBP78_07180 [Acidaminococcales bacterium]|jgi:hypothetical protein|nr:hypothetical protein [Acidaminococcales bacterium]
MPDEALSFENVQARLERQYLPVLVFKDGAEMNEKLRYWQRLLFLDDWIIKGELTSERLSDDTTGAPLRGKCSMVQELKAATIYLYVPQSDFDEEIVKFCHEDILVHELLHCKYNILEAGTSYEARHLDLREHVLLEEMARSLIMARYNIGFEWFSNVG